MSIKPFTKPKFTPKQVADAAKDAEKSVHKALAALKAKGLIEFERIPDSRSAGVGRGGNIQKGRRGDFDVMCQGLYSIIEVKNSLVHGDFKGLNIAKTFRPAQLSAAYQWKKQGARPIALFHGARGDWYHLPTNFIADMQIEGHKSIPCVGALITDTLADAILSLVRPNLDSH